MLCLFVEFSDALSSSFHEFLWNLHNSFLQIYESVIWVRHKKEEFDWKLLVESHKELFRDFCQRFTKKTETQVQKTRLLIVMFYHVPSAILKQLQIHVKKDSLPICMCRNYGKLILFSLAEQ